MPTGKKAGYPVLALIWLVRERSIVRRKDETQTCRRILLVVSFPSTGGVDVSIHTLDPANPVGHRRRSHGYAVRPRRSETMNCHYMMRWRWESSRDTWSGARGLELGANGKLIGSHRARKRSHSAQDDDRLKVCLNRRARGKNRLAC